MLFPDLLTQPFRVSVFEWDRGSRKGEIVTPALPEHPVEDLLNHLLHPPTLSCGYILQQRVVCWVYAPAHDSRITILITSLFYPGHQIRALPQVAGYRLDHFHHFAREHHPASCLLLE